MSEYRIEGPLRDCISETAREAREMMDRQAEALIGRNNEEEMERFRRELEEAEEFAAFQSRLFRMAQRRWADYASGFGHSAGHPKSPCRKNKEVAKRRKKNRNKKTHRRK